MIQAKDATALDAHDTPYLNWPRLQQTLQDVGSSLTPFLVRLKAKNGDVTAALSALADAVLACDIIMDRDDLALLGLLETGTFPALPPNEDDVFTVFLPQTQAETVLTPLPDALEVLQIGRNIDAPDPVISLAEKPKTDPETPLANQPIVAVIDDGIGFLNTRFCRHDLRAQAPARYRSRFHAVWLQAFQRIPRPAFGPAYVQAGQVLLGHDIDALLAQGPMLEEGAIYRQLNQHLLEPGAHSSTEFSFTHGTHILDLAAGADPESDDPVQEWPLLAVQLPPDAVDNTAGTQLEPCIIDALRWTLRQAERINSHGPVIINVSFATFAGSKDGSKPIEALAKHILERWQARTGREARLVLAFGNARRHRQGAIMDLPAESSVKIDWCLQPDDFAPSYLELRPLNPADLSRLGLVLTGPGGLSPQTLGPLLPNTRRNITDAQGRVVGAAYHIGARPSAPGITTPAYFALAMAPSAGEAAGENGGWPAYAPHGAWTLDLSASGGAALPLRIEVQRGDTPQGYRLNGRQSYLDHPGAYRWDEETFDYNRPDPSGPINRAATHSSFVTGRAECIYCVGASRTDNLAPCLYSPDGASWTIPGPTLSAEADRGPSLRGLVASGTFSGSGRALNGTSAAAAVTTRMIASGFHNGQLPAPPATSEAAHLIATYGSASVSDPSRQGLGILHAPARVASGAI
jgi:hypothetical protein